jgi:putative transposase
MLKAIKIRLYPDENQKNYISNLLGSCRFAYNKCLEYKIGQYNEYKKSVSFGELGKNLLKLKNENDFLKEIHSKVLQQTLINLQGAYNNFFKNKKGFPKFKSKKDNKQSCRFPIDAISGIHGNRINIIKVLKDIHFKCSVKDEKYLNKNQNLIKSATLTKTKSNKYYFSILIDRNVDKILSKSEKIIGIDVGIKYFVVCSDGKTFDNIKIKRNNQKKLIKLNRQLSKKVNGSKNKEKQRIKLAKYHEKLNNQKEYYLHSVTNRLINDNQVVVIEDLNISGMLKNHKLAKSIQELSLNRFKTILNYKSDWYDRQVIEIDRWFPSSKLCSVCGYKNDNLTLKDREWICPKCNTHHNRDFNAAKNIENEGKRIIKIGLSSPELTLVDYPLMDDKVEIPLKSYDRKKQENNELNKIYVNNI